MSEAEKDGVKEFGAVESGGVEIISIIGEIEGHDNLGKDGKTTKYEHMLPMLAGIERESKADGILFLVNTIGGDVSCGLALAEMIAGLGKPTVSLVLGDSHSIGVPVAVATDYSFIVPSATVVIHPVRMSGTILGASQTYKQFKSIQDRIIGFIAAHSRCPENELENMMMETHMMAKDLGTILVGQEAVDCGIIDEVGDIRKAFCKLNELMGK
ncbi:MAG: ATP-dependent Clp protease proteolytic subunit [Butyrivibrio sp.]|nr:ATP-dependent Clp protease proteolytic subunit [Butyrivibrio sp.]